jgi:adenosylcobyric acid synthase
MDGLGLLPMTTTFAGTKETHRVKGRVVAGAGLLAGALGAPVQGYEIHMGRTSGEGADPPFRIDDRTDAPVREGGELDGALDASGRVLGTYIHGLFHNAVLRRSVLEYLARAKGAALPVPDRELTVDQEFDKLADWVRSNLKMDLIYQMTGLSRDFYRAAGPLPAEGRGG